MTRAPSTEVLRLQVADDPTGLVNLVANPNGELGGWGWVTPTAGTAMTGSPDDGLTYTSHVVGAQGFQTEDMPITAGWYAAASWNLLAATPPPATALWVRMDMQWIDAGGAVLSTATPGPWINTNTPGVKLYGPNVSPVGAVKFRLRLAFAKDNAGTAVTSQPFSMRFNQASVATAATAGELGTMKVNFVPDPSFEAVPITANWSPSGPNVSVVQDANPAHGSRNAKLTATGSTVRTNLVLDPNFDYGTTAGWQAGTSDTSIALDSPTGTDSPALVMHGNGTNDTVQAQQTPARFIPVAEGDRVAVRVNKYRFGTTPATTWPDGAQVQLGVYWTDGSGNLLTGSLGGLKVVKTVNHGTIDTGTWFFITGTKDIPAGVAGVRVAFKVQATGKNISATMSAWLDMVMVEKAASVGGYFDGDSLGPGGNPAYAWTGTAGHSTSTETTVDETTATPGVLSSEFPTRGGRDGVVSAYLYVGATSATVEFSAELHWFDASHNPLTPPSTVVSLGEVSAADTSSGYVRRSATLTSPPAALFARVAVYPMAIGPYDEYGVDAVQVEPGTTLGPFIVGEVTTGGLPYLEPISWIDILGATHDITVTRQSLNVGTLVATVLDANLDPSRSTLIRPGRACRLLAYPWGGPDWSPLFTGTISQAEVAYDPEIPAPKRATVSLTAVDALATLSNIARPEGVGTVADLPYVLEGCGVPWDINGSGNQVPTATVVARNDSSSALDQVAITRDSVLGVAWLDRLGTLHAYDDAADWVGVAATLDEDTYSGIEISFNTSAVINEVNLAYQRFDPETGDTDEVPYGPYTDEASVAEWGAYSADFRVQGLVEDTAVLEAYAQAILDANAVPVRRVNTVTVPIRHAEDITPDLALLDLENLTTVTNLAADLTDALRLTSIQHHITTTTWLVEFGFAVDGQVASPTFTPAPGNTGGLTLSELLRPVGEVTMFYGALSAIPAGWLPLDGSTFSSTDYPELATLLGGTTLPNMTDRFPIGAGTKALGTSGGSPTAAIGTANLPAHQHGGGSLAATSAGSDHPHDHGSTSSATGTATGQAARGTATNTGTAQFSSAGSGQHTHNVAGLTGDGGFAGTALSVLNPWRSLWFIIRAR